MLARLKSRLSGWSLIELTIILVVLSILCAILAPTIGRYVRNAKVIRAREDVQAIGCAVWMFIEDTANGMFLQDGDAVRENSEGRPLMTLMNRVNTLVGDGDIPELNTELSGAEGWIAVVNFTSVDFLEYHLCTNRPGDSGSHAYRTPNVIDNAGDSQDPVYARDESGGFNAEFAWRGPYVTAPIDPDPWGNRYAVNVKYLDPRQQKADPDELDAHDAGYSEDVIVLCRVSDEEVDTQYSVDGQTPGDDDIIYVLSANSRP